MPIPADTQLLDWLERQNAKLRIGKCSFRSGFLLWCVTASSKPDAHPTVRAAIAAAMDEEQE